MSIRVHKVNNRWFTFASLNVERRARGRGIGDGDGALRKGVQVSMRIVEKSEGFVAGVDNRSGGLQAFQSIDIGVGGRDLCRVKSGVAETTTVEMAGKREGKKKIIAPRV